MRGVARCGNPGEGGRGSGTALHCAVTMEGVGGVLRGIARGGERGGLALCSSHEGFMHALHSAVTLGGGSIALHGAVTMGVVRGGGGVVRALQGAVTLGEG